jgi:GNAT superfamily N-acetyltransferase
MAYEIKLPSETTEQMVLDIAQKIDSICYPMLEIDHQQYNIGIFRANPLSYLPLFHNETLSGYVCMFPISEKAYSRITEELDETFCSRIDPADILRYEQGKRYRVLIDSIAVLPAHQGLRIFQLLIAHGFRFIHSLEQKDIMVDELIAYALNPDIVSFIERRNFKKVGQAKDGTLIYTCKKDNYAQ